MNANEKRAFNAAMRAARSVGTAAEKLQNTTADFIKTAGGFEQAIKLLNEQRKAGRTWKVEREENSPLYRVYNCVTVAKSRAKPGKRGARQTTGKAGEQAGKAGEQAGKAGEQAGKAGKAGEQASRPASPADLAGVLMMLDLPSLIAAFTDQTATTTAITVDRLRAVADALDAPPAPRAPAKRAPAKRAPAKRATK